MDGASKIDCPETTCSISGVPYNDLFTGTTSCFIDGGLSGSCFNSVEWVTNIYEDSVLTYSNAFYSSTSLTGSVIDIITFSGSVATAFDTLEIGYSFDGSEFTIDKGDFSNLQIELTTELNADDNCPVTGNTTGDTSCSCPIGFTATTNFDACQAFTYTAATLNGTPVVGSAGNMDVAYGANGTYFYPNIDGMVLPLIRDGVSVNLKENNGAGAVILPETNVLSPFWGQYSPPTTTYGRLNNVGLSTPLYWVGFSKCIDIPVSGTYYVGLAADNYCKFKLNGELILDLNTTAVYNFKV